METKITVPMPVIAEQFDVITAIVARAKKAHPGASFDVLTDDTHKKKVDRYMMDHEEVLRVETRIREGSVTTSFHITRAI